MKLHCHGMIIFVDHHAQKTFYSECGRSVERCGVFLGIVVGRLDVNVSVEKVLVSVMRHLTGVT